jgi:hypothetical protein
MYEMVDQSWRAAVRAKPEPTAADFGPLVRQAVVRDKTSFDPP